MANKTVYGKSTWRSEVLSILTSFDYIMGFLSGIAFSAIALLLTGKG